MLSAPTACERVARFWDEVTCRFLRGEPTNEGEPLDRWFAAYAGRGRGEVDLSCFPEPYLGDILGSPRAAVLGLNPGGSAPAFQSREGIFSNEIRTLGSYRNWARTWPYLREPWGKNNYHQQRIRFLRRWFDDPTLPPEGRIDFELYPWHSGRVTAQMRPDRDIIEEFIWAPLRELPVKFIFAFGSPWFNILDQLPEIDIVRRIGHGGTAYATSRKLTALTAVVQARTSWGAWLIIEKHSGAATPPSAVETDIIKRELGFA